MVLSYSPCSASPMGLCNRVPYADGTGSQICWRKTMLHYAVVFFVIALIAALFASAE
jgi:hypothetical protein